MKRMIVLTASAGLVLAAGCARFSTTQQDQSYDDEGKPIRAVSTRATASTFFAGRSALESWKSSQTDKTQGGQRREPVRRIQRRYQLEWGGGGRGGCGG